jgi:hypothetical protein
MEKSPWKLDTILALLAIALGLVPMLVSDARILHIIGWLTTAILLAIIFSKGRRRRGQIPIDAWAVDFTFSVASLDDLNWIAELERRQFNKDAVPLDILREWYEANPNGFLVVRDDKDSRVGHIDILPVREPPFKLFEQGTIVESGIRGNSLFSPSEREKVQDLYVESIVILGENEEVHRAAVTALLNHLDDILAHVAVPANIRYIYGLAATREATNS